MSGKSREEIKEMVCSMLERYKKGKIGISATVGFSCILDEYKEEGMNLLNRLEKNKPYASPIEPGEKIPMLDPEKMEKLREAEADADEFVDKVLEELC